MKIHKLEYHDQEYEWKLDPVEFTTNPTLLVGISGAGKTQILHSILNLKKIVNGDSLNGVKWNITFSTKNGAVYCWQGEFETQQSFISSEYGLEKEYKIIGEILYKDDNIIVERTGEKIKFNENLTPKLSPNESALHLLKREEDISPAVDEINKITKVDFSPSERIKPIPYSLLKKYQNASLSEIQQSGLSISTKLSLVARSASEIFEKIKREFRHIFNQIEDIKIEPVKTMPEYNVISFKEKGINNWINQLYMSSGMLKILMYISELYLSPKGSVMLIDEFENSLGVNCLDSMTEIVTDNKDLQFILTSHHPYIINNISPKHWKIVTRKGGVVQVKDPQELGISKSREKAFIDLINILEDYPDLEGDGE